MFIYLLILLRDTMLPFRSYISFLLRLLLFLTYLHVSYILFYFLTYRIFLRTPRPAALALVMPVLLARFTFLILLFLSLYSVFLI